MFSMVRIDLIRNIMIKIRSREVYNMKNQRIVVTSKYERFVHWVLAISCLLLCYTGLGMMFKELNFFGVIFGGLKGLASVHNIMAVVFAIALVLAILMWWKEAGLFVFPEDWEWIKAAG